MRYRSFATNVDVGVCGKQCGLDPFCHAEKAANGCGGSFFDPLFGVGQTDKERLLQHGITYAEPGPDGKVIYTNPRGGDHKPADCSGECKSLLDIGCYWHKMINACGGSTGLCDVSPFPGCEGFSKYLPIVAILGVVIILYLLLKRR